MSRIATSALRAGALLLALAACSPAPDLVVYCSLDQEFSEPLIAAFERETGLRVDAQFDVERNKTVGMVQRLIAERAHPRADVFWNNEIAQTIRLKELGLTEPFAPPSAALLPAEFRDPDAHWHGFAARARVILYRTDRPGGHPRRFDEMLAPEFAARGGLAKPLTGTTLTHFAVLAAARGAPAASDWIRRAEAAGLRWGSGNADVMRAVARGDFDWGLTDTDDAAVAVAGGHPVAIEYLEQDGPGSGTVLIPNTVCVARGAPHRAAAERFVSWLLRPETEAALAAADSRQIPLMAGARAPEGVGLPGRDFAIHPVDWPAVAATLEDREKEFRAILVR